MKKIFKILIILIIIVILFFIGYNIRDVVLRKIYVTKYSEYVQKYSKEYDVDEYLIYAIIKAESNFNEKAVSSKGAIGLMQLMESTAQDIAKSFDMEVSENEILDPEININFGTKYISTLMKRYNCIELALCAYNAGSGNVDSWIEKGTLQDDGSDIENIPYKETNNYVRKILNSYKIYKELYQK